MPIKKETLCVIFLILLLTTEFYYIEVFGGTLRIYHLLAPLVILALHRYWPRLAYSNTFWLLLALLGVNGLSAALADSPKSAFLSLGLFTANILVGVAVALMLISGRLRPARMLAVLRWVVIVSVFWGMAQLIAAKILGVDLSLSLSQKGQIAAGFAPGFRTEANAFAKFLNVSFLLLLPSLLAYPKLRKSVTLASVFATGLLISFTRSVLYTLPITLFFIYAWNIISKKRSIISLKVFLISIIFFLGALFFISVVGNFNTYAAFKIQSFFNPQEILDGGSSGFRLMSQGLLWDAFLSSDKTILFGNGWGQVKFFNGNWEMQAGGADIIVFLAYGGIISGITFVAFQFFAIRSAWRLTSGALSMQDTWFFQGCMYAILGINITGFVNGSLIAPEYWMLFGIAMFADYEFSAIKRQSRALGRSRNKIRQPV